MLDSREVAPLAADKYMFVNTTASPSEGKRREICSLSKILMSYLYFWLYSFSFSFGGGGEGRGGLMHFTAFLLFTLTTGMISMMCHLMSNSTSKSSFLLTAGPYAIAVPGQIAGMWEAWLTFGRVQWSELFQPAIRMARHGMIVDNNLAEKISNQEDTIRDEPSLR